MAGKRGKRLRPAVHNVEIVSIWLNPKMGMSGVGQQQNQPNSTTIDATATSTAYKSPPAIDSTTSTTAYKSPPAIDSTTSTTAYKSPPAIDSTTSTTAYKSPPAIDSTTSTTAYKSPPAIDSSSDDKYVGVDEILQEKGLGSGVKLTKCGDPSNGIPEAPEDVEGIGQKRLQRILQRIRDGIKFGRRRCKQPQSIAKKVKFRRSLISVPLIRLSNRRPKCDGNQRGFDHRTGKNVDHRGLEPRTAINAKHSNAPAINSPKSTNIDGKKKTQ